jgi:pyruvate, orthophosphate dikinase
MLQADDKLFMKRDHKWVYAFQEGQSQMKGLLGGKGANIAEMLHIGLPVPPGFTITTEACNAYFDYGRQFPEGMWSQTRESLAAIEEETGKTLGDPQNPLLLSVRSGAAISMPGMMDTVLNLGLNDETVEGLATLTNNRRFALDAYRRFISMFGTIVLRVDAEKFEHVLDRAKTQTRGGQDTDLTEDQLTDLIRAYKRIVFSAQHGEAFPQDVYNQLRMAISTVFDSWNTRRAEDYRRVHHISANLGTAVNVQAMVFGNLGWDSGTGVAFTRNPSTGEKVLYGEYLLNAQGEDVVAGIRTPSSIKEMANELSAVYRQLQQITATLENHYGDMQDIEFTIEHNKLYLLQTRTGKRTGQAAIRIVVDMVDEGMIDRDTALMRIDADSLDQLLHPMIDPAAELNVLTTGLPASPGAASGIALFSADEAETCAADGQKVILVRHETSPDNFHGMVAAEAILTVRGGMTSHAAVVARSMGKPCVVGAGEIHLDYELGQFSIGEHVIRHGEWITLDGSTGRILEGKVPTVQPQLDHYFETVMGWADEIRHLGVRANADNAHDAAVARQFGAEGIGLCRTEHMFFTEERLAIMREMILADNLAGRENALEKLLPIQRQDFLELFTAMEGLPVTIRLLDPPLHEFLPDYEQLRAELYELKLALMNANAYGTIDELLKQVWEKEQLIRQIEQLREFNPMLGFRGVRLGFFYPEITRMQATAILQAACEAKLKDIDVHPEIMIPLVIEATEVEHQRQLIEAVANDVMDAYGMDITYSIGTMIELPRAALTAHEIACKVDFFSFGTNDLTQTTFGMSRDDSGRFLPRYIDRGILTDDPFQVLDQNGVGQLVELAIARGTEMNPQLKIGICGEHGGEPRSVAFCHHAGMAYVSCSPYRVPIARLSAAKAVLSAAETVSDKV